MFPQYVNVSCVYPNKVLFPSGPSGTLLANSPKINADAPTSNRKLFGTTQYLARASS